MKRLYLLAALLLVGCDCTPKNTARQAIYEYYTNATIEVVQVNFGDTSHYIVRDCNNGAVWDDWVPYNTTTMKHHVQTHTPLFQGLQK
jgi:hypothetical protein